MLDEVNAHRCLAESTRLERRTERAGSLGMSAHSDDPDDDAAPDDDTVARQEEEVYRRAQAAFDRAERLLEKNVLRVSNVNLMPHAAWSVPPVEGTLILTTFLLRFEPSNARTLDGLYVPRCVPLALVESAAKQRESGNPILEISLKDGRLFRFSFGVQGDLHAEFFTRLLALAYGGEEHVYAFVPHAIREWRFSLEGEYARLGVPGASWRVSHANAAFELCSSYPAALAVPAAVTDAELVAVAKFRSRGRLPGLTWLHPHSGAALLRCSQPLTGISGKRSAADEAYFKAITQCASPAVLDAVLACPPGPRRIHILDARPRANAVGNSVKGAGYTRVSNYDLCDLKYLDIANIHAVRTALHELRELCSADSLVPDSRFLSALERTRWLDHARSVLAGAVQVVQHMSLDGHHVVVHCSDGWDRTAQVCALAQLMLDGYYRTLEGFAALVEKDWVAFGHLFARRTGHGNGNVNDDQRAPIFLQFIECVWQLMQQAPRAFEYSESLLLETLDAVYSCKYGTFLGNSERARRDMRVRETTSSLWGDVLAPGRRAAFTNPAYAPFSGTLPVIVRASRMAFWRELHLRWHPDYKNMLLMRLALGAEACAPDPTAQFVPLVDPPQTPGASATEWAGTAAAAAAAAATAATGLALASPVAGAGGAGSRSSSISVSSINISSIPVRPAEGVIASTSNSLVGDAGFTTAG